MHLPRCPCCRCSDSIRLGTQTLTCAVARSCSLSTAACRCYPDFFCAILLKRALQSFWPGLQALYGDVEPAAATLDAMLAVMHRFKFVPEAFNLNTKKVEKGLGQYPLRPEVAESLFYLYQATGKEEYREAGRAMVNRLLVPSALAGAHTSQVSNLNAHARTKCGFAAVENVAPSKKPLRDHMDSYFLAETLKFESFAL